MDASDAISMDDVVADSFIAQFNCALVGRLLGQKIHGRLLVVDLHWWSDKFGNFRVTIVNKDCFICIFEVVQQCDEVLRNGPWTLGVFILGIDVWSPTFHPMKMPYFSTPVWIRHPDLPLIFWDIENIGHISTGVGQQLWVDRTTSALGAYWIRACLLILLS